MMLLKCWRKTSFLLFLFFLFFDAPVVVVGYAEVIVDEWIDESRCSAAGGLVSLSCGHCLLVIVLRQRLALHVERAGPLLARKKLNNCCI